MTGAHGMCPKRSKVMADEKLASFKIGDKHKPRVKNSPSGGKEPKPEAAHTLGFARIEEILDSAAPGAVGQRLAEILDDLDAGLAAAKTPKDKSAYKKGRAALERTIDLLDYLFRTKESLMNKQTPEK